MNARRSWRGRVIVGLNRAVNAVIAARPPKRFRGAPLLLLTTTGRSSGQPRTTPLLYLADGERYIVVASNGGSDWEPGWRRNLDAGLPAHVDVDGRRFPVNAHELDGDERAAMWERLNRETFDYQSYQDKVTRRLAVIALVHGESTEDRPHPPAV